MIEPTERRIQVTRTLRYYTAGPATAAEKWLVCHGYAQLAGRFIGSFLSLAAPDRQVVAPEAPHRFYLDPPDRPATQRRVGASWMTREDRETDIADYIAYLDQLYDVVITPGTESVHVLGFSQGVATVARWIAATDRRVARVIFWGGLLPPDLDWPAAVERFTQMRVQLVAGSRDEAVPAAQLAALQQRAREHELELEVIRFAGGHTLDAKTLQQLA